MPDIEDSLRRYADALERSATARVDAPPHRRRGALVACAAALAVVAIASTAVFMTSTDRHSRVNTVGRSSSSTTPPIDPNVWVTATVKLDKKTFIQGEDVTGEITFTNHLPTDAFVRDDHGCLEKWGVGIAPGHFRIDVIQTTECRSGPTFPVTTGRYMAFHPGVTRVPLRVSGTFQECTGSDAVTPQMPHCLANNTMPNLPIGPARVRLVISDAEGRVRAPGPIPIRIVRLGSRPPFCSGSQISIRETEVSLASGAGRATFLATNASRRRCTLDGYPDIGIYSDLVTRTDRYSQITSDHSDSFLIPRVRPRPVTVPPGGTASFSVGYSTKSAADASTTCGRKLTALPIRLPDNRDLLDVPTTMDPCPGTPVGAAEGTLAVTVSPFVAGSNGVHR